MNQSLIQWIHNAEGYFVKHVIRGKGFIWKQVILCARPMNVFNAVIEQREEGPVSSDPCGIVSTYLFICSTIVVNSNYDIWFDSYQ